MRTFSCRHCRQANIVPDNMLTQDFTCPHCNTGQIVPATAAVAPESDVVQEARAKSGRIPFVEVGPTYGLAMVTAVTLWFAGVIIMLVSFFSLFSPQTPLAATGLLIGLVIVALAQLLLIARTIAIQTYRP